MPNPSSESDDLAPTVDPADLQRVFNMMRMMRTIHEEAFGQHAIDIRSYEMLCSAGSDAKAVWYRVSMLLLLCRGPLSDGDLDDKVFRIAAQFPMKQMQVGVPQQGPPFDVNEFLKQIEESA
jgi:hypothetical protein